MSTLRAAMTQTVNAYTDMPAHIEELSSLADKLDDIRKANLDHHAELISHAAGSGAGIIGLGELFAAPYFALTRDPMWRNLAEDATIGPTVTRMKSEAQKHNIVIVAPIYELCAHTGNRFNTAAVIDRDGTLLGTFRKAHIPCGSNEQGTFDESFYYGPASDPYNKRSANIRGDNPLLPVFTTAVGRIGVSICYDRHFAHMCEGLVRAGAQLIYSPAVTFGEKSRRMWDIEFECDAARHNVFIGGSNRLGSERPWRQDYFGESHFVGPNGRCENISEHADIVIADLTLDSLDAADPSGWNLARDTNLQIDT